MSPGPITGSYRAISDDRPATEGRSTTAGAYPIVSDDRATSTGGYRAVDDSRPTASGGYRAVTDHDPITATGGHSTVGEDRATSTGGYRAVTDHNPATATGGHSTVGEGRATTTGGYRAVPGGRATSTGGFRIREGRATSSGSFRSVSEGRSTSTGGHRTTGETRATSTGGHRTVTEGRSTVTGTHRAMGKVSGRRRIAKWPVVAGAFVVLLVAGLLAWGWANNVLNSRAEAQANACTDGNSTLTVVVTPSAQKPVSAAATRWNQANTVVHAHCVHVDVRAIPSAQVLDALTGKTDLNTIGGLPAAWVPENSSWIDKLQTAKPGIVGAPAESVASAPSADYPFLGLAGNTVDEVQARAAQVFRDYLREPAQRADFTAAGLTAG